MHMVLWDIILPPLDEDLADQIQFDLTILEGIRTTRYLRPCTSVAKSGNLHLAWKYAQNKEDHGHFINMLRVSPQVFEFLLGLIQDHEVFKNNSNNSQTPVNAQLAVTLYCMSHFGNGASLEDLARIAGCSEGAVELYTDHCFQAIESLHDIFVHPLTPEEKEKEKEWMDEQLGFQGLWHGGWLMYDGTIVVLYAKPGENGELYYTQKANYGLNVQVCQDVL
jgi:hypothetical protein